MRRQRVRGGIRSSCECQRGVKSETDWFTPKRDQPRGHPGDEFGLHIIQIFVNMRSGSLSVHMYVCVYIYSYTYIFIYFLFIYCLITEEISAKAYQENCYNLLPELSSRSKGSGKLVQSHPVL